MQQELARASRADGKRAAGEEEEDVYIPYTSGDMETEAGLSVHQGGAFMQEAARAELNLDGDDAATMRAQRGARTWSVSF